MDVGFTGVGRMGRVMARNLLQAGHRVLAWDVSGDALDEARRDGAAVAASASEAFRGDAVLHAAQRRGHAQRVPRLRHSS